MKKSYSLEFGFKAEYLIKKPNPDLMPEYFVSLSGNEFFQSNLSKVSEVVLDNCLQIEPANKAPWLLEINGDLINPQVEGIYGCPCSKSFLAVVDSVAYYISSELPLKYTLIESQPVRHVNTYPALDLVLVLDYTGMTAIGPHGILWNSNRLVRDELKVITVTEDFIFCCGDYNSKSTEQNDFAKLSRLDGKVLEQNLWTEP